MLPSMKRPKPPRTDEDRLKERVARLARKDKAIKSSTQGALIEVMLPADGRKFVVYFDDLNKDPYFKTRLTDERNFKPYMTVNAQVHVFGYYVLWLLFRELALFVDLSLPIKAEGCIKRTSHDLIPTEAYKNTAMYQSKVQNSIESDPITIAAMSDARLDAHPLWATLARRYINAYFMGQSFGANGFTDAIMNEIVRGFHPDIPLSKELVAEVYGRSPAGSPCEGLKKFLVDYAIWSCYLTGDDLLPETNIVRFTKGRVTTSMIPPSTVGYYDLCFERDMANTLEQIRSGGEKYVDFRNVTVWLLFSNGAIPTQRCRYHQHTDQEMCLALLVDNSFMDTSIKAAFKRNA